MLLRASGELTHTELEFSAVTEGAEGSTAGIAHGDALVRFAEAVVTGSDAELDTARTALLEVVGAEAFIDAAAVTANFQRMVRIADSTGIPLDAPLELVTQDLRAELGLERFGSSSNTPPAGALKRFLGAAMRPLARVALRRFVSGHVGRDQRA